MISPLPGAIPTKPGCTQPLPGIVPPIVDSDGEPVPTRPRRLAGHHQAVARHAARHLGRRRAIQGNLLEQVPDMYFTGDGCRQDADGYFWIMGRIDDVLNVAGHRLSTMEMKSALVSHPKWPRPRQSAGRTK